MTAVTFYIAVPSLRFYILFCSTVAILRVHKPLHIHIILQFKENSNERLVVWKEMWIAVYLQFTARTFELDLKFFQLHLCIIGFASKVKKFTDLSRSFIESDKDILPQFTIALLHRRLELGECFLNNMIGSRFTQKKGF